MSIEKPLGDAIREQEIYQRAATAFIGGKITSAQREYYIEYELKKLRNEEATRETITETKEEARRNETQKPKLVWDKSRIMFFGVMVFMFALAAASFFVGDGITGYIAYEPVETPFSVINNTNITLNTTLTAIRVSGSHSGNAEIHAWIAGERLLIYTGTATLPDVRVVTDKEEYGVNETVLVSVYPETSEYTLWLIMPNDERIPVSEAFTTEQEGSHLLEALVNNSGTIEKVSVVYDVLAESEGVLRVEEARAEFVEVCGEACNVNGTITELELIIDDKMTISELIIETAENNAPIAITMPAVTMDTGEEITINLSSYFSDQDGDKLLYDINNMIGVNEEIIGEKLTLSGDVAGEYAATIYASDLAALAQTTFTLTINEVVDNTTNETITETNTTITNTTNETIKEVNETIIETNQTITNTTNETIPNVITNGTLDCSHPDPNLRPLECLQNKTDVYFPDQSIMISDNNRELVARITPIGNLLLTGDYYENSAVNPANNDYTIGYRDEYNNYVASIWFETSSGNLYVNGLVIEENSNLQPAKGSYVLRNERGIVLAWANAQTGDFYVRGNIIPYRRSLE